MKRLVSTDHGVNLCVVGRRRFALESRDGPANSDAAEDDAAAPLPPSPRSLASGNDTVKESVSPSLLLLACRGELVGGIRGRCAPPPLPLKRAQGTLGAMEGRRDGFSYPWTVGIAPDVSAATPLPEDVLWLLATPWTSGDAAAIVVEPFTAGLRSG